MSTQESPKQPQHCLSFDIEEHFQVSAFESPLRRRHWESFESRVENNTKTILNLLAEKNVKATFFVLGWVAERHPNLIRSIAALGHEIASHGYSHELITAQTPTQFRNDIRKTKAILEDLIGKKVLGYRAPSFSITRDSTWALPILVEEGHMYDSSIFPVLHDRYGLPGAQPVVHALSTGSGDIWEIPPSTVKLGGSRFPIAGGGYFRLIPFPVFLYCLKKVVREGLPLVTYLHPWELDPEQPKMKGPILSKVRHYLNLHKTKIRLEKLLDHFPFGPINAVIEPIASAVAVQSGTLEGVETPQAENSIQDRARLNGDGVASKDDLFSKGVKASNHEKIPTAQP